jgi:hypothetical protein
MDPTPGIYDDVCTFAREAVGAEAAILIIVNGTRGSGFSCQAPRYVVENLAVVLRSMADKIEADLKMLGELNAEQKSPGCPGPVKP